jgi:predicted helicase
VRIVDPACGSGAFLRGVVERLQRSTPAAWSGASLVGIDVLPASCAVARCLLALAGAVDSRFGGGSRGGLYSVAIECVNPLLAGDALEPIVLGDRGELPVILGNPPYANFGRMNRGAWIDELLDEYRADLGERKLNLTDDFIKFFRWGQHWIDRAGRGVLALVTSRTYLDGLTHRGMRASLCRSFDEVYVLDLGGDVDAQRSRTAREADENVFGIRRGVAIGVFVKSGAGGAPRVRYHAIQGSRAEKMASLDESDLNALAWQTLAPDPPAHDFVPRAKHSSEYRSWPRIVDVFPEYISGVQTKNDALLTDFCRETLAGRIRQLLAGRGDGLVFREALLRPYLVAPLDVRWIYYEPRLVGRPRWSVMRHMLRPNRALVFMRQSTCEGEYDHFLATDALASDRVFYSTHGAPFLAPLWLYEEASEATAADSLSRRPNLDRAFADELARRLNLRYVDADGMQRDRDSTAIRPEDIFHYAYGVFFDADYRRRFADELRVDFPRLPPVEDPARFRRLRDSGRRLAKLHVAGTASAAAIPATIPAEVWRIDARYPRFADEVADPRKPPHALVVEAGARGGVWLNRELLLAGIAGETWEFRLGGYDALPRWLRQRRGRALDDDQRRTLLRLIATIRRTRSATKTSRRG